MYNNSAIPTLNTSSHTSVMTQQKFTGFELVGNFFALLRWKSTTGLNFLILNELIISTSRDHYVIYHIRRKISTKKATTKTQMFKGRGKKSMEPWSLLMWTFLNEERNRVQYSNNAQWNQNFYYICFLTYFSAD